MTDMAQADRTLRRNKSNHHQTQRPFTWAEIKPKAHIKRGDICVLRSFNGAREMLRLDDPFWHTRWIGCFTYIGE